MNLYERIEPKEGELVQFLGVYALRWPWHSGVEPTVAFNEFDDPLLEAAPELLEALVQIYGVSKTIVAINANDHPLSKFAYNELKKATLTAEAAIAKAKGTE